MLARAAKATIISTRAYAGDMASVIIRSRSFHVLSSSSSDAVMTGSRSKRGKSEMNSSKKNGALGNNHNNRKNSKSSLSAEQQKKKQDEEDDAKAVAASFPFSNLSEQQFQKYSDEIRDLELPLQAFFARHRPLLVMDPGLNKNGNLSSSLSGDYYRQLADEQQRYAQVWSPKKNLFETSTSVGGHFGGNDMDSTDGSGTISLVSSRIAKELGPFNIEHVSDPITRSLAGISSGTFSGRQKNKVTGCTVLNLKDADKENAETTTVIFARTSTDESPLQAVITFLNDNIPESYSSADLSSAGENGIIDFEHEEEDVDGMSATSVKRKRKLKMNRHKYRKRMKAQRSLRKRLGK